LPGVLYGVLALIVLAGVAAAAAIALVPADIIRDRIAASVKEKTGRDLVINGAASITLYPSLGVTLKDVTLSSAPDMAATKPLVSMNALDAKIALLPLLQREVRVETLVLHEPVINLEIDKEGRKSWSFAPLRGASLGDDARGQQATPSATTARLPERAEIKRAEPIYAGAAGLSPAHIEGLRLDDVRIENGALSYRDARTGTAQDVKALTVRVGLHAINAPLTATGNMVWRGRKLDFDGTLTSLSAVLEDRPAKLSLTVLSDAANSTFEGTATFRDTVETEGMFSTKSPSMRSLLAWFGTTLPPSKGFGPLEAKGLVRSNAKAINFSGAEIALDGAIAHGQIALETSGARPYVKANLKLDELNLNTYASEAGTAPAQEYEAASGPPSAGEADAAAANGPVANGTVQSIDDILAREAAAPGPKVKGFTQRAGWSEEPYRLTSLAVLDADAKLSVGRLILRDVKVGQTELTIALKNRVMKTTIDDVRLYEGRGRGFVTMDASNGRAANVAANLTFDGLAARQLLIDAAGIDRLSGKGRLAFTLSGQGANERQLVETLNGKVELTFADGAISGVNVPQMIRAASQGRFNDLSSSPSEKTDFSELSSTWAVTSGIAQNQDLKLVSPLLRLSGSGNVMLPGREVDYVLRPRLVAELAGQGGNQNASGLEIPVRMHGSWDDPKFTPDLQGIMNDPTKAVDTIKEIGRQFKGKNAGEIVDGLLGRSANGEASSGKKLLEQFLKK
jgi:AsmA protein